MTLSDEYRLVVKLLSLGLPLKTLWDGTTSTEERIPQVREQARKVRDVVFSVENGKQVTISHQFYRAYGEELK